MPRRQTHTTTHDHHSGSKFLRKEQEKKDSLSQASCHIVHDRPWQQQEFR